MRIRDIIKENYVLSESELKTFRKAPTTVNINTRVAGDLETQEKLKDISIKDTETFNKHMSNLQKNVIPSDVDMQTVGHASQPTPNTLPAIINKNLRAAGKTEVTFHQVKNLPGYISNAIRTLGKSLFSQFTTTPITDIQVVANFGGSGPNSKMEINALANYIIKNGAQVTDANIDFENIMPGYTADIKIFDTNDVTFMLVKDFAGEYIYSWPSNTKKIKDHK